MESLKTLIHRALTGCKVSFSLCDDTYLADDDIRCKTDGHSPPNWTLHAACSKKYLDLHDLDRVLDILKIVNSRWLAFMDLAGSQRTR